MISTPHHRRSTCRMAFLRRLRSANTVNCRGTLLPLGCFLSSWPNFSRVGVGSPARLFMMACFGTPASRQPVKVDAVRLQYDQALPLVHYRSSRKAVSQARHHYSLHETLHSSQAAAWHTASS